jgi:outer membrane receptor protein involved in Fe transport
MRSILLSPKFIILLCSLLFPAGMEALFGQTLLKGKVTDASNGEALMSALITVDNTTDSTQTNFDGEFELRTTQALPLTITIQYSGYNPFSINIIDQKFIHAQLKFESVLPEFKVEGKGPTKEDSPQARVSLGPADIENRAAPDLYTEVGTKKEIDLITASLGFQILNTRGFNSTSPVRMLQVIDGVDNQSPGLNFSLGNFLGTSELDILRLEVISGASGPFYGPNAFNGVISQETKDPFIHAGLTAMVRAGERNLLEGALRYAHVLKNKNGDAAFAYKLNLYGLTAHDWIADNTDPVSDSKVPADNPGRYDAVNIYGDEFFYRNDFTGPANEFFYPGLGVFYRTGYHEKDLVDYNTKNFKGNLAFQWRMKPKLELLSPEFILSASLGTGTTIYQGDNRFSLRNILFIQPKIEFRKREHYFLRAYYTVEDAGKSYDPYFTALKLQDISKSDNQWTNDYIFYWLNTIVPKIHDDTPSHDSLTLWHTQTEDYANLVNAHDPPGSKDFFVPGTTRFDTAFAGITSRYNNESSGTRFYDHSALLHVHGEYLIRPEFLNEIRIGGSFRQYLPDSKGTIFHDTAGTTIRNSEFGLYAGIRKGFLKDEKLVASATFRLDKNENFKAVNTYAASLVYQADKNTYLRLSYSTALRNPTLSDQYLYLNVGPAIIAGHTGPVNSLITIESFLDAVSHQDMMRLEYFDLDRLRPEYVSTYEIGLRTKLWKSLYLDA